MEILGDILNFLSKLSEIILDLIIKDKTFVLSLIIWIFLLWVAIKLFEIFRQAWLFYKNSLFKQKIEWTFLEIKIPREVLKTPRAMEQFFKNIHSLRNEPGDFMETYNDGEVTLWWSLEIISLNRKVHFYIKTPKKHMKIIEAGLYAQYPTVEIIEVKDYLDNFPNSTKEIYRQNKDIFGGEFYLGKENYFPINTYENFELTKEELVLDPVSALIETLINIHEEEFVAIQILIEPTGIEWKEKGEKYINKFTGRESKKSKSGWDSTIYEWARNLFMAPNEPPVWSEEKKEEKKDDMMMMFKLTPGEQETIKAIENKISKPGFETLIRFLYIAPKNIFNINFVRKGILGVFNQYSSQSLNFFKNNNIVETWGRWYLFPYFSMLKRVEGKKQRLFYNFKNRLLPEKLSFGKFFTSHLSNFNNKSKTGILNVSEIATIFHIPGEIVLTSPHIERTESKKMGPPAGLPIFEE